MRACAKVLGTVAGLICIGVLCVAALPKLEKRIAK